ncbi:MAG: hypothetical protein A2293_04000 [Elusimicrobia bacterium RIFOXYB2_FULL_49_7]|nr:MAG: hypothetical protein A2293_04000 [Elusimicrobia bacterium RIFOXYB2_FULL_49_7]
MGDSEFVANTEIKEPGFPDRVRYKGFILAGGVPQQAQRTIGMECFISMVVGGGKRRRGERKKKQRD